MTSARGTTRMVPDLRLAPLRGVATVAAWADWVVSATATAVAAVRERKLRRDTEIMVWVSLSVVWVGGSGWNLLGCWVVALGRLPE